MKKTLSFVAATLLLCSCESGTHQSFKTDRFGIEIYHRYVELDTRKS